MEAHTLLGDIHIGEITALFFLLAGGIDSSQIPSSDQT